MAVWSFIDGTVIEVVLRTYRIRSRRDIVFALPADRSDFFRSVGTFICCSDICFLNDLVVRVTVWQLF
jgi:hypothetical protein